MTSKKYIKIYKTIIIIIVRNNNTKLTHSKMHSQQINEPPNL